MRGALGPARGYGKWPPRARPLRRGAAPVRGGCLPLSCQPSISSLPAWVLNCQSTVKWRTERSIRIPALRFSLLSFSKHPSRRLVSSQMLHARLHRNHQRILVGCQLGVSAFTRTLVLAYIFSGKRYGLTKPAKAQRLFQSHETINKVVESN